MDTAQVSGGPKQSFVKPGLAPDRLSGIQTNPLDFLDAPIELQLDFLQETGAINAIFPYSQTYHLGDSPANVLATDHPIPPRDTAGRSLPNQWLKLPDAAFADLVVRHEGPRPDAEYSDRDIFAELLEPCHARGIKLYPRILEAGMRRADRIPGYTDVATVDLDGNMGHGPCWNHPDYREWVRRTAEQTLKLYPVDGFQYGAERVGSLSEVLFKGVPASCFCEHCRRRAQGVGIDWERLKLGFRELTTLTDRVAATGQRPVDGMLTEVLRCLFKFPEMSIFYREWLLADAEIQQSVYTTCKALRPEADIGQHVDHQKSSWDIFYRAAVSYADMAAYNDYIKPIVYHEIFGPRLKEWVIDEMQKRVLADFSKDLALELFYAAFGLDPVKEPEYANLHKERMSPDYVFRETRRCVEGVAGRARVYAGVGLDVPHYVPGGMAPVISDPESVYEATRLSFEAGAAGVLASREYREITKPSLQAFGRAVRSVSA